MKRVLGYVLGLVAALSLAGAAATTANADGGAANAGSGQAVTGSPRTDTDTNEPQGGGANDTLVVPNTDSSSVASSSSESSVSSSSSASSSSVAPTKPEKPSKKPGKVVANGKKMRGEKHYRKNSTVILFQKGRKGASVVLRNRKGQFVEKFSVKKSGRFSIKLSKKAALKLSKFGKNFTFTVSQKGFKTYTIKYLIFK